MRKWGPLDPFVEKRVWRQKLYGETIGGMDFLSYLRAMRKIGWALMSCAVFTFIWFYVAYTNKDNHWTVRALFLTTLALSFVAGFLAWKNERRALMEVQTKLKMPELHGEILAVMWDEGYQPNDSRYYAKIRLVNYSDVPCTIARYGMSVFGVQIVGASPTSSQSGDPTIHGEIEISTHEGRYKISEVPVPVHPLEIDDKNPLQRGIDQIGWVRFYVEGYPQPHAEAGNWQEHFALTVTDSLGNEHVISAALLSVRRGILRIPITLDSQNIYMQDG